MRVLMMSVVIATLLSACTNGSSSASAYSECRTADLTITLSGPGSAAGHFGLLIHFRDVGSRACSLAGYPGVDIANSAGSILLVATPTPSGYMGGLKNINHIPVADLKRGGKATAVLEEINPLDAQIASCQTAPDQAALLIYPPNQSRAVRVPTPIHASDCSNLEIHPVLAGSTGAG